MLRGAARTSTYAADNRPEDIAEHLARSFGPAQQAREIGDPALVTLLAERDGALVGFAQLRWGAPPVAVTSRDAVEIQRFYVDRPWHRRGVAQALMGAALAEAGAAAWLGVWERNPRAIAFYRKLGFVEVGSQEFLLGSDRQRDVVMLRTFGDRP